MEQPLARILLPALRGGDTLGFLAALGVIHLSHSALSDTSSRLSWPHGPAEGAVVHSSIAANLDELASLLAGVAAERREPNLVPGLAAFPPNSSKPADTDPIRTVTYEGGRVFSQLALEHPVFEPWLRSILSLDQPIRSEKRHGALAVSPLAARGPGTVMLARTMRDLAAAVTTSTVISALAFWERSDTIAGYLDPQAKRNAAFAASKQDPNNYGVPAAAWLGMMALPFFPASDTNTDIAAAPGWVREPRSLPRFTWPVWSQPLVPAAIAVLLAHPSIAACSSGSAPLRREPVEALSVSAIFQAVRTVEGNNDGALSQGRRIWSAQELDR